MKFGSQRLQSLKMDGKEILEAMGRSPAPVPGTMAAVGALEESGCSFEALSPPRAGKSVLPRRDLGA